MVPESPLKCNEDSTTAPLAIGVREAARLCSLSVRKINYLIADGTIASFKLGRRRLILTDEIRTFIAAQSKAA